MSHAWAQSTQEGYSSGLLSWHIYCDKKSIPELQCAPASQPHLATFVASLTGSCSSGTIANYLYDVHAWHILHGMEWKLNKLKIDALLKGAERLTPESSKWKKRQPYTTKFMSAIHQQLNLTDPFDAAVFACLTTCFYATACVGELTVPWLGTFNITHHVTPVDLHTENNQNGTKVTVCYVPYHRLNSISISARDAPQMHSWSSYITSHMLPLPIQTIPILVWVLRHPTICENTFTLSSALHLLMDSTQHMYTYSASRSMVMHGADTICSVSLATHLYYSSTCYSYISTCYFQNLPHAHCPLLPIMFHPFSI